jgi:predicted dehydrogenase
MTPLSEERETEMDDVRYGLIGTGYFGMGLGRALAALKGARITRVYDPENSALARDELGAAEAASVAELVSADDVDAVVVASPNGVHPEGALAAARAGRHVFCEKPIALSYAECAEMVDVARENGVVFMAGHIMNFFPGVRRAKELITAGAIGDLVFCRAVRNGWEAPQPSISWKKQRHLSGGHLYHHIHELDLVQFLMGPAVTATMVGGNVAHTGPEFGDEDDLLLLTLEFDGSRFAALEYGSAFRWPEHHVLVQGTRGAIRIDLQDVGVTVRTPDGTWGFPVHRDADEDLDRSRIYASSDTDGAVNYGAPRVTPPRWLTSSIEDEVAYFHALMRGASPTPEYRALTDGSAARDAIATADALTVSLVEGRKVDVAEILSARTAGALR